jgi:hypothetical protein
MNLVVVMLEHEYPFFFGQERDQDILLDPISSETTTANRPVLANWWSVRIIPQAASKGILF